MDDDNKPRDPEVAPQETADQGPDDQPRQAAPAAPDSPEAEFAASEADQPEAARGAKRQRIWSDDGDAPFDDSGVNTRGDRPPTPRAERDRKKTAKDSDGGDRSAASEGLEIIKTVVVALLIAFVLRVLLFQPFTIPSASMEPNLYEGDYIVVSKWAYGYSKYSSGLPINLPLGEGRVLGRAPERGDIAVFKLPRDNRTDYIKRVIGLPGDQVQMRANKLYINGQPVQDVVLDRQHFNDLFGPGRVTHLRETLPGGRSFVIQDYGPGNNLDDTGVYLVPQGHYFMMGDNRDNSIDSRVDQTYGVGLVPEQNLVGKAEIIMFSWEPGASLFNPVSWFSKIRLGRFFTILD